jgi:hypothetical protein
MQHLPSAWSLAILLILTSRLTVFSQNHLEDLQPLYEELDSLFADDDIPDNLFELADSILALENAKISALNLSVGYVSEVVIAGRSLGLDQYGIAPSAAYFHQSGLQAGITGYWSSDYEPALYLTDINVGYSKTIRKFTFQINHDFFLYNDSVKYDHLFNKTAQGSVAFNLKRVTGTAEYSFLYGNSNAHRITSNISGIFKVKTRGWINAVTFMPGATFQWGNADIYFWRQPRTALTDLFRIIQNNDYPRLERGDYRKLTYLLETEREAAAALFLRQRDYTPQQILDVFGEYYDGSVSSTNAFGFMNFSMSFPVIVRARNFSLLLNYTYNMPQSLPGETYTYEPNGYFSSSISYLFSWIKK